MPTGYVQAVGTVRAFPTGKPPGRAQAFTVVVGQFAHAHVGTPVTNETENEAHPPAWHFAWHLLFWRDTLYGVSGLHAG